MMNLNDTISAFRCCTQIPPMCKECPLTEMCKWNLSKDRCKNEVKLSVNHWLKAQEPRVLELEEVEESKPYWLNMRGIASEYAICKMNDRGDSAFLDFAVQYGNKTLESNGYGKTWRCWTSRPTDEQREAIPWND